MIAIVDNECADEFRSRRLLDLQISQSNYAENDYSVWENFLAIEFPNRLANFYVYILPRCDAGSIHFKGREVGRAVLNSCAEHLYEYEADVVGLISSNSTIFLRDQYGGCYG